MENFTRSRNLWIGLGIIALLAALLFSLSNVVAIVATSFMIAYFLDPVVDWFEAHKISRTFAILILLLFLILILTIVVLVFVPMIISEISQFVSRFPDMLASLEDRIVPLIEKWTGGDASGFLNRVEEQMVAWMQNLDAKNLKPLSSVVAGTFSKTYAIIAFLFNGVMVLVFTFYFLRDFDIIKLEPLEFVPPRYLDSVKKLFVDIDETLSGFVRGQGTVCLILASLYSLGYGFSGVPLGVMIGLTAGIFGFIPYFGAGLGLVLSILMLLLDWQGWGTAIAAGATFLVVSNLESFVLTPKIVGHKVGLSPVMVILALMVGGELFGFAGVVVALPVAAVLNILWRRAKIRYQESEFYAGE